MCLEASRFREFLSERCFLSYFPPLVSKPHSSPPRLCQTSTIPVLPVASTCSYWSGLNSSLHPSQSDQDPIFTAPSSFCPIKASFHLGELLSPGLHPALIHWKSGSSKDFLFLISNRSQHSSHSSLPPLASISLRVHRSP